MSDEANAFPPFEQAWPDPDELRPEKPASYPTDDQIARFARLTAEERFLWLVGMQRMLWEAATPEARANWRRFR
jgi:thiamine pyrophosphate-dependent acetolactate synthase large subunit-like protein